MTSFENFAQRIDQWADDMAEIHRSMGWCIDTAFVDEEATKIAISQTVRRAEKDISSTIEKFHNPCNLPEIQGSRLKDLMYGTGE